MTLLGSIKWIDIDLSINSTELVKMFDSSEFELDCTSLLDQH